MAFACSARCYSPHSSCPRLYTSVARSLPRSRRSPRCLGCRYPSCVSHNPNRLTRLLPFPLTSVPTYFRSHLLPFPLTSVPTYFGSRLLPFPLTSVPTYFRSHLLPFPLTSVPTYFGSRLLWIPLTYFRSHLRWIPRAQSLTPSTIRPVYTPSRSAPDVAPNESTPVAAVRFARATAHAGIRHATCIGYALLRRRTKVRVP